MRDYQRIEKVIRYLEEHYHEQPSLKKLAAIAGVSEFHFHRLFKKWAGITPKDFLKFLTANHAKELLLQSRDLLSVSLESGLSGSGRLHDLFVSLEAVTPGEYKSRGKGIEIFYGYHETPFGDCLIGVTNRGVCHLSFCGDKTGPALEELQKKWSHATLTKNQKMTKKSISCIWQKRKKSPLKLLVMGTSFQVKVWEALLKIPEGHLLSYSDVAKAISAPKSSRAVGTAVGDNTIAYLIPCHRVIRESGKISQYRWGADRKKAILLWESGLRGH